MWIFDGAKYWSFDNLSGREVANIYSNINIRKTREGWPLLIETEANREGVQMKGVLPWFVRWACRAGTREFCSALAALVGPVQKKIPHRTPI